MRYVASDIGYGLGIDVGWSDADEHWSDLPSHIELRRGDFMDAKLHPSSFDVVTCLETLEHVPDPDAVLQRMWELLVPGGMAAISVPIELGPSLLMKEGAARIVRYRRTKNPAGRWRPMEIARAVFGDVTAVKQERAQQGRLDHKGFDFRDVERSFRHTFAEVHRIGTPFPALGPWLNVGVILTGRKVGDRPRHTPTV